MPRRIFDSRSLVCSFICLLAASHVTAQNTRISGPNLAPRAVHQSAQISLNPSGGPIGGMNLTSIGGDGAGSGPATASIYGTTGPALDFDLFEQELRSRLDGNCIGYSFAFNVNGQLERSGFGGIRRTAADGGVLNQSASKRMHIASVAKNITATAAIRLLSMSCISLDESIANYMPSEWVVDASIQDVTFHHLLSHTSGFQLYAAPTDYTSLKVSIALGTDETLIDDYEYDNRNFGLLRVLLPYAVCPNVMEQYELLGVAENNYEEVIEQATGDLYVWLVDEFVFKPIAIPSAQCKPNSNDSGRTRFYNFPADGGNGQDGGDWTTRSGGAGWVLSSIDLAQYMSFRRYTNHLLSDYQRDVMDSMRYGWQTIGGDWGTYLCHGGSFTVSGPLTGVIMQFPNCNVEAVLLINSNLVGPSKTTVLRDSFDAAWQ